MTSPRYCRKCGTNLLPDSQFCPSCGTAQHTTASDPTKHIAAEPSTGQTGKMPAGSTLHNRYRLLHALGQGGMGAVYLAQDTQLADRLVAVKEMSQSRLAPQDIPQAVEQFKQEAHTLASLHHPNLPVIYDHFTENNRSYLAMSFIEGGTLQAYLNDAPGNKLPVKEVVRIGIELCNVLDYLHSHRPPIIFRDLKPLNIMITPQGHIYLIDFGIARHFKQDQTKDTAYYYSVGYAPPEQYGQSQTGPRSDIYSLGATLHQMLSGHHPSSRPFHFANLQIVDPTIPVPLAKLIVRMLEMNEQARPVSMAEVREQLEKTLKSDLVVPTQKADSAKKADKDIRKFPIDEGNEQTLQGFWNRIDIFARKGWNIAWFSLIALALIVAVVIGVKYVREATISSFPDASFILSSWWPFVISVGIFLTGFFTIRVKRTFARQTIGCFIALLGEASLLAFFNQYTVYTKDGSFVFLLGCLNLLLLFCGTSLFLAKASKLKGAVFGFSLAAIGIIMAFLFQSIFKNVLLPTYLHEFYSAYETYMYNTYNQTSGYANYTDFVGINDYGYHSFMDAIPYAMWVPSVIVGIASIIISFRKKQ